MKEKPPEEHSPIKYHSKIQQSKWPAVYLPKSTCSQYILYCHCPQTAISPYPPNPINQCFHHSNVPPPILTALLPVPISLYESFKLILLAPEETPTSPVSNFLPSSSPFPTHSFNPLLHLSIDPTS